MIKRSNEEVWLWYNHILEQEASGINGKQWCERNSVDYKTFCNYTWRINWKSKTDREMYDRIAPLAREYLNSGKPMSKFCREHKADIKLLTQCATHLNYVDLIDRLKAKKEPQSMNFIQVPAVQARVQEPELVEKQNDIEITITKGVRVSIAPNIDPMKIIKIIELLKDL